MGPAAAWPPKDRVEHLIDWLHSLGWYISTGMGIAPIDWQGLAAWKDIAGPDLSKTEASLLMKASRSYVGQYNASRSTTEPPPYIDESKLPPGVVRKNG